MFFVFFIWCLICLPNIGLSMLTIYGTIMAPALTAPTISQELNAGTWDMLLVTPFDQSDIIFANGQFYAWPEVID